MARNTKTKITDTQPSAADIRAALKQLDFNEDSNWTGDGLPSIAKVAELIGCSDSVIMRNNITDVAPNFTRKSGQAAATDDFLDEDQNEVGRGLSKDEKAAQLDDAIAKAEQAKAEAETVYNAARSELDAAKRHLDELITEKDRVGRVHPMVAIQAHIASQQAQRAARNSR